MQTPFRAMNLLRGLNPQCHITDNDGTKHHGGLLGEGSADIAGWIDTLKPLVEETDADIGEVPATVVEFGAPDPDAEAARTIEYMIDVIPQVKLDW